MMASSTVRIVTIYALSMSVQFQLTVDAVKLFARNRTQISVLFTLMQKKMKNPKNLKNLKLKNLMTLTLKNQRRRDTRVVIQTNKVSLFFTLFQQTHFHSNRNNTTPFLYLSLF